MNFLPLMTIFLAVLVIGSSGTQNKTKAVRKTLRMMKPLKKSFKTSKTKVSTEHEKLASYRVPIIVSAPSGVPHHNLPPLSVEVHEDDRHIHSSPDIHPIEPIHLLPFNHQPKTKVEVAQPRYSSYSQPPEYVFKGPVAVPQDYPYGSTLQDESPYDIRNKISPGEYYSENYDDFSAIPGIPGIDYPTYTYLPSTGFKCLDHTSTPGFYADVETKCQMWHYCQPDGRHDRFLCPNGTIFDQMTRVCNWWFNVHCDSSLSHYDINFDLYREPVRLSSLARTVDHRHPTPSQHSDVSVVHPKSFLKHVEDFEAKSRIYDSDYKRLHDTPYFQSAAASPQEQRYPIKLAPAPLVKHDDTDSVTIGYDSSNSHSLSAPSAKMLEQKLPVEKLPLKKRKRLGRRKHRKQAKAHSKRQNKDNIPTYREAKATPATRRYRIVRRRKVNKT